MKEIKWGFIGCGEVTEKKSGPAFNEVPGSQVVAVMSRSERKRAVMLSAIISENGTLMLKNLLMTLM